MLGILRGLFLVMGMLLKMMLRVCLGGSLVGFWRVRIVRLGCRCVDNCSVAMIMERTACNVSGCVFACSLSNVILVLEQEHNFTAS